LEAVFVAKVAISPSSIGPDLLGSENDLASRSSESDREQVVFVHVELVKTLDTLSILDFFDLSH
jgi:hypothetical protein